MNIIETEDFKKDFKDLPNQYKKTLSKTESNFQTKLA